MSNFFAGRMHKLKRHDLKGMQYHNQRERESQTNRSINKSKTHLNYDLIHGRQRIDYEEKINQRIKEGVKSKRKPRKDAVLCNQWIITSDKSFFDRIGAEEERRFFQEAYQWFAARYGKENIAFATVHKDEHTPHMHLGVVPITKDGRLSSKDIFNRKELLYIQEEFPKYIQTRGFDLQRGIPSKEKHVEPTKWKNQQIIKQNVELEKKEKRLGQKVRKMKAERNQLEEVLDKLTRVRQEVKPIAEMQAEPVMFGKDRVKVLKTDWEALKAQAVEVWRLRADNEKLQKENLELRKHLINKNEREERLTSEIGLLRKFISRYQKEFDRWQNRERQKDRSQEKMIDLGKF